MIAKNMWWRVKDLNLRGDRPPVYQYVSPHGDTSFATRQRYTCNNPDSANPPRLVFIYLCLYVNYIGKTDISQVMENM